MCRRLGQHFLRPASVERLLRAIAPGRTDVFLEIGPGRGALTLPLAARRGARRGRRARRAPRGRAARARAPPTSRSSKATPSRSTCVRSCPRAAASPATFPTTSRARCSAASSTCATTCATCTSCSRKRLRAASPPVPGSKEYGILSVLYGLHAEVSVPLRFPPGAFEPPPKVSSALLRAVFLPSPAHPIRRPESPRTARPGGLCPAPQDA